MSKRLKNGLFIFRRDLRIVDNNALQFLSELCEDIYTIFIFTPEQVGSSNKYKSNNSVQFMIESLKDLSNSIKKQGGNLNAFYGHNDSVVEECIKKLDINIVAFNLDITPYSRERDNKIIELCEKLKVFVTYDHDYYLHNPDSILNGSGKAYLKFTPYYNKAKTIKVNHPLKERNLSFKKITINIPNKIDLNDAMQRFTKINDHILVNGGRTNALKQLQQSAKNISHYSKTRDTLNKPTSHLSAYLKFGCLSIREVYYRFKSNDSFIRQLYWRDFYGQLMYNYPQILKHSLKDKFNKIKWHKNERWFRLWCEGKTGIPIVDASQRQLVTIGWTHNRGRMISSSILTKIFMIDWREGERFYAQHLVDYDVANNNGGWTWSSGVGVDSQEYWRTFNPYTQSKEHDPECEYIKTWIPELKDVPAKDIHNWDIEYEKYKATGYPKPIVDYAEQKEKALKMYKDALY